MYKCNGTEWFVYQGVLLPKTPPHIQISLTRDEAKRLLKKSNALLLRYTTEWDRREGEFWYVIKDSFGGMEELSGNTRSKVRRGLKNCTVRKVHKEQIVEEGYEVYKEAFKHYTSIKTPLSKMQFKVYIAERNDDFWAVYHHDKMIAYSQNRIEGESINYAIIKFHPDYLKLYPSYALFYTMNEYYLNQKDFLYVNDGARSISHETNIQTFLIDKFKFRKSFVKLVVIYRWDIRVLVRLLYPLRHYLYAINVKVAKKIAVVLRQEEIRRSYE